MTHSQVTVALSLALYMMPHVVPLDGAESWRISRTATTLLQVMYVWLWDDEAVSHHRKNDSRMDCGQTNFTFSSWILSPKKQPRYP